MATTKTVQIVNTANGGFVSPGRTPVAQGDVVLFTIDSGTATVFLPNTGDFEIAATARTATEGGAETTARGKGAGIQLRVGPKDPARIKRKAKGRSVEAIPFAVCIDGAQAFAMPATSSVIAMLSTVQVTSPVMILDPP
jgi:hypothetical protein